LLHATSLRTHETLPLGVDDQGQPVYAVYTNLAGGFKVYVPASEQGNVLLTAEVPAAEDDRLRFAVLAPANATAALLVDEDAAVSARYVRQGLIGRLMDMLTRDPAQSLCLIGASGAFSPALKEILRTTVTDFHTHAVAVGIRETDHDKLAVWALAERCADTIIAEVDLRSIVLDTQGNVDWGTLPNEGPEPALAALGDVLGSMRDAAAARLAQDPKAFEQAPSLLAANGCAPGRYQILKGSDVGAFMVDEYLSRTARDVLKDAGNLIVALGVDNAPNGVSRSRRMKATVNSVGQALSQAFVLDTNGVRTRMVELIQAYKATYVPIPGEPKPNVLPPSCIFREECILR
ncbi:MAG: hypothetical protein JWM80_6081, partial [Cyanobacteria bacterium RYN_339]|nr:hypothetical protein [Cyanobacteria bacterium RYN_339]